MNGNYLAHANRILLTGIYAGFVRPACALQYIHIITVII